MDHDVVGQNKVVGRCYINLTKLPSDEMVDMWYPLQDVGNDRDIRARPSGSIRIRVLRSRLLALASIRHAQKVLLRACRQSVQLMTRLQGALMQIGYPMLRSVTLDSYKERICSEQVQLEPKQMPLVRAHSARVGVSSGGLEIVEGGAIEGKIDDSPSVAQPNPGEESAGDTRVVGHQLEVAVVEARNVGRHLFSWGGERHASEPWDIHKLYVSVRSGNAIRRTRAAFAGADVTFLRPPSGLVIGQYRNTRDSGDTSQSPFVYQIKVVSVDASKLGKAVAVENVDVVRGILPNMALARVNNVCLNGLGYETALEAMHAEMGKGFPVVMRFVVQDRKVRPPGRQTFTPTNETSFESEVTEKAKRAKWIKRWQQECRVSWQDVLQFGDVIQPQTGVLEGFSESLPSFGPCEKLRLCVYERNATSLFGSKAISAQEEPLYGNGVLEAPREDQQEQDRPHAHLDKTVLTAAMYFLGDNGGLESVARPVRGSIDPLDHVVAIRDNIRIPALGEVIDKWYSLSTEGSPPASPVPGARSVTEDGTPEIRVILRWVPLRAARSAVRADRYVLNLRGIGVSIIDRRQELLHVSVRGIHVDYSVFNGGRQELEASIHQLQIDNQVPNTQFPVVLSAFPVRLGPRAPADGSCGLLITRKALA